MVEHISSLKWYLTIPRPFSYKRLRKHLNPSVQEADLSGWSFCRCIMENDSDDTRYPVIKGWSVYYEGELIVQKKSRKEIEEFIKEKLEN